MPYSHHSHSGQFCAHASSTLEQVVQAAIAQKFTLYCLTEHCPRFRTQDLYPEEIEQGLTPEILSTRFQAFLDEATRLKIKYANEISLLVGVETEHIYTEDLDLLQKTLEANKSRIDLVVGSIHHVNEIPIDFDKDTFERAVASYPEPSSTESHLSLIESYLDAQHSMIQILNPTVIAHFDLFRLYTPELILNSNNQPAIWAKLERNILLGVEKSALFEVNAAAFRKGWNTAYPGRDILQLMLNLKVRLCLSDDSHGTHMVGLNYKRAREYLLEMGVQELWYLDQSGKPMVDASWSSHPFWDYVP
ncbi:Polymerase/histidinol phosphatase-like protein [Flagelloscypha sp. PMI_526]|nr:Polymerase/histidinol phosphatase-like protein [Flagelloscypha sp. PMI_526]